RVHLRRLQRRRFERARVASPEHGSNGGQAGPAKHAKDRTTGHGSLLKQSASVDGVAVWAEWAEWAEWEGMTKRARPAGRGKSCAIIGRAVVDCNPAMFVRGSVARHRK